MRMDPRREFIDDDLDSNGQGNKPTTYPNYLSGNGWAYFDCFERRIMTLQEAQREIDEEINAKELLLDRTIREIAAVPLSKLERASQSSWLPDRRQHLMKWVWAAWIRKPQTQRDP
jgi:hypothetical protein